MAARPPFAICLGRRLFQRKQYAIRVLFSHSGNAQIRRKQLFFGVFCCRKAGKALIGMKIPHRSKDLRRNFAMIHDRKSDAVSSNRTSNQSGPISILPSAYADAETKISDLNARLARAF
jgi:hypothetical protein